MNIPQDLAALLSSPQSGEALKRTEAIIRAINSPEGRKLLSLLGGPGAEALAVACRRAAESPNAAKTLVTGLGQTPEGAALLTQLFAVAGRKAE